MATGCPVRVTSGSTQGRVEGGWRARLPPGCSGRGACGQLRGDGGRATRPPRTGSRRTPIAESPNSRGRPRLWRWGRRDDRDEGTTAANGRRVRSAVLGGAPHESIGQFPRLPIRHVLYDRVTRAGSGSPRPQSQSGHAPAARPRTNRSRTVAPREGIRELVRCECPTTWSRFRHHPAPHWGKPLAAGALRPARDHLSRRSRSRSSHSR